MRSDFADSALKAKGPTRTAGGFACLSVARGSGPGGFLGLLLL
jgi:hypothetical protein